MSVASMISVEQARAHIMANLAPTGAEIVPLAEAWSRVTAADVTARLTQPAQDISAMDGYAVRAGDANPRRVVGSAPAGHPWAGELQAGQALRLFTGSVLPAGADSVILQEDVTRDGDQISISETIRPGQHIRRAGEDFAAASILVKSGTLMTPRHVGLMAAGNHPWVAVHRRPVIAILATGDEIVLPGEKVAAGSIVSSNAHALAALVKACGGIALVLPIAGDTVAAIAQAAASAAHADMLVTTGGASVGEYDLVAEALTGQGLQLNFWKIAMRPGKPLMHGSIGRLPLLGLPGNPVSAYLCAVLFLKPAIERLCGLPGAAPVPVSAILAAPLPANDHRADHLRCRVETDSAGRLLAYPASRQDSGMLRVLADASGVILRPPFDPALAEGADIQLLRLDLMGI